MNLFNCSENDSVKKENLNYIFEKPLPIDSQIVKIKEACGAFYLKEKMENSLLNLEALGLKKNGFELKAVKCPQSLIKGSFIIKVFLFIFF